MEQPPREIANYPIDGFIDHSKYDFMSVLEGQKLHYLPTFTVRAIEKLLSEQDPATHTS